MIIIKQNEITIPRGISPSFITDSSDINLQNKAVTISQNGVSTITADSPYDALSSLRITTDVHPEIKLENIVKTYTENGQYTITHSSKYDGIGNAVITIQVPEKEFHTQEKNDIINKNGEYSYTPDNSYDGLSKVTIKVNIPEKEIKLQDKTEQIISNGDYDFTYDETYDGLKSVHVDVNVPIPKYDSQVKDVSFSNNGSFTLKPDEGFDGISQANVTVNVPEKTFTTQEKTVPAEDLKSYTKDNILNVVPDSGIDGLSKVSITKVSFEGKEPINPSTKQQVISPSEGYQGFDVLTINAVDNTIDSNIQPDNIKKGVEILGVEGTYDNYVEPKLQEKTIDSSSLYVDTKDIVNVDITPDEGFDGLSKVSYKKLNLAKNRTTSVASLPASGTYTYFKPFDGFDGFLNFGFRINYQEPTIDPSTNSQTIDPSTGYACFKNVTVNPVKLAPNGIYGYHEVVTSNVGEREYLVIKPTGDNIGLTSVEIEKIALKDEDIITPTQETQTIVYKGEEDAKQYSGVKKITVNPIPNYSDYRLLKYIQSDGACAFVLDNDATRIFPDSYDNKSGFLYNHTNVEFNVDFTLVNANTTNIIYTWDSDDDMRFLIECNDDNDVWFYPTINSGFTNGFYLDHGINVNSRQTVQVKLKNLNYGEIYTSSYYIDSKTTPNSDDLVYGSYSDVIMLFAKYANKTFKYDNNAIKIHNVSCNIYDNDKLVKCNFIPVLYKDEAGFLETNSMTFCKNLGTGTPLYELL